MDYIDETSTKNDVLEAVMLRGEYLFDASNKFKDDEEVVSEAMDNYPSAFQYASERIRELKSFAIQAVMEDGMLLDFVIGDTREDIDVLQVAITQTQEVFTILPQKYQDDPELIKIALLEHGDDNQHLNFKIERDWDLIQTILEEDPDNYGKLNASIQIIPCLVRLVETKYPSQLSKIPVSYLRKNDNLARKIVLEEPLKLGHCFSYLREDEELCLELIKKDARVFQYISPKIRVKTEFIDCALVNGFNVIPFLGYNFRIDKDFALRCIRVKKNKSFEYKSSLIYLDMALREDPEVILNAIIHEPELEGYIPEEVRNTLEIIAAKTVFNKLDPDDIIFLKLNLELDENSGQNEYENYFEHFNYQEPVDHDYEKHKEYDVREYYDSSYIWLYDNFFKTLKPSKYMHKYSWDYDGKPEYIRDVFLWSLKLKKMMLKPETKRLFEYMIIHRIPIKWHINKVLENIYLPITLNTLDGGQHPLKNWFECEDIPSLIIEQYPDFGKVDLLVEDKLLSEMNLSEFKEAMLYAEEEPTILVDFLE